MKSIREKFEEIWPAPDGIEWDSEEYMPDDLDNDVQTRICYEMDARLETFALCQETTELYMALIADLTYDLGRAYNHLKRGTTYSTNSLDRAKQLLEQYK